MIGMLLCSLGFHRRHLVRSTPFDHFYVCLRECRHEWREAR